MLKDYTRLFSKNKWNKGGDLDEVIKNGINNDVGLLINSSRGIIYAGNDRNFDSKSREEALKIKNKMSNYL